MHGWVEGGPTRAGRLGLSPDLAPDPSAPVEWWYAHGRWTEADGRSWRFIASFIRGPLGNGRAPSMLFVALHDLAAGEALRLSAVSPGMVALLDGVVDEAGQGRSPAWLTALARDAFARAARSCAGYGLVFTVSDAAVATDRLAVAWDGFALTQADDAVRLAFTVEGRAAVLTLRPAAAWSRFGGDGPAARAGIAHYRSCPRMTVDGHFDGRPVRGEAWFDHQRGDIAQIYSQPDGRLRLLGWEWFSLNLDDGRDLMLYQPREQFSGRVEHPFGAIFEAGGWRPIETFAATPRRWLCGPLGAHRYPVDWRVEVRALGLSLDIRSLTDRGELPVYGPMGFNWQGPVEAEGESGGEPVRGTGWLELNGYGYPVTPGGQMRFWSRYLVARLGLG